MDVHNSVSPHCAILCNTLTQEAARKAKLAADIEFGSSPVPKAKRTPSKVNSSQLSLRYRLSGMACCGLTQPPPCSCLADEDGGPCCVSLCQPTQGWQHTHAQYACAHTRHPHAGADHARSFRHPRDTPVQEQGNTAVAALQRERGRQRHHSVITGQDSSVTHSGTRLR